MDDPAPALKARGIRRTFVGGDDRAIKVLRGIDLEVVPGEMVAVTGASGSGKSTLLHLLGGLDRPDQGNVEIGGRLLGELDDAELSKVRNGQIGFVFQFHHLLRGFTAIENVMVPALISGILPAYAKQRARELLAGVGLEGRDSNMPHQLSGGELQRVALARALMNRPRLLLADEPSGNLDNDASRRLYSLFDELRKRHQLAFIVSTHDLQLARDGDRLFCLEQGFLVSRYLPRGN